MSVVNPQQAVSAPSASAPQPAADASPASAAAEFGDYSAADIEAAIAATAPQAKEQPPAEPKAQEQTQAEPEGETQAQTQSVEPETNKQPSRAEQRIHQLSAKLADKHKEVLQAKAEAERHKAANELLLQKYQELEAKRNEYDPVDPKLAKLEQESLERQWQEREAKITADLEQRVRQAQVEARAEVLKEKVMSEIIEASSAHPGVTPQDIALAMSRPDYDVTKTPAQIASEIHKVRLEQFQKIYGKQQAPVAPSPLRPAGQAPVRKFNTVDDVVADIALELGPDWFK